jgi:hypothetical protein
VIRIVKNRRSVAVRGVRPSPDLYRQIPIRNDGSRELHLRKAQMLMFLASMRVTGTQFR